MISTNNEGKVRAVGVQFGYATPICYFDATGLELSVGDRVVVETRRGLEIARVVVSPFDKTLMEGEQALRPVLRVARDEDIEKLKRVAELEKKALTECSQLVLEWGLPMKPIKAEYNLDGNVVTIFFTAEGRVDFRELVRQLSNRLGGRVELRQVGPRDEAKLLGGFGPCGRPLCCSLFLTEFSPVSIKMAKDQDLALNPSKISGVCGRLLCCLDYERNQYCAIKAAMPLKGSIVNTPKGKAVVVGSNVLRESVMLEIEGGEVIELSLAEVTPTEASPSRPEG